MTELQSQHLLREDPKALSLHRIEFLISLSPFHIMEGNAERESGVWGGVVLNNIV